MDTQQLTYLQGLGYDRGLAAEALRQVRQVTRVAGGNMQAPSPCLLRLHINRVSVAGSQLDDAHADIACMLDGV